MFEVRLMTKDGKKLTPCLFDKLDEAIECFRNNHRLGLQCALYNLV